MFPHIRLAAGGLQIFCAQRVEAAGRIAGMVSRRTLVFAAACLSALGSLDGPKQATAQTVFRETFDGSETSWQPMASDTPHRVLNHRRTLDVSHSGAGAETITIAGRDGSFVEFAHPTPQARVIRELKASLWVRANRPGLQLSARIVLPRSKHPRTGKPLTTLIAGPLYRKVGEWERLEIDQFPVQLNRQVYALRSEFGSGVDPREAYLDFLVMNVYGGSGTTEVWLDDLELAGTVERAVGPADAAKRESSDIRPVSKSSEHVKLAQHLQTREAAGVVLQGPTLLVAGRPLLPRVIQHQGEPLPLLRELGFNVVRLAQPADENLLAEAARLGLWLISPPPNLDALPRFANAPGNQSVVAWDLGHHLSAADLDRTREIAQQLRRAPGGPRLLIVSADADVRRFGRIADVLVIGRPGLGTSLEAGDLRQWFAQRPLLARPGTPIWAKIETDPNPLVTRQWQSLASLIGDSADTPITDIGGGFDYAQIRLLTTMALASGARGLWFDSRTSLAADNPATRLRRLALQLLNLELALIEPWVTGGSFVTSAESSDRQIEAVALQTERARLLLPIRLAKSDQYVVQTPEVQSLSFIVAGVPESNDAYELSPLGLHPLRHKRVTGGIRVMQDRQSLGNMMVMTADPVAVSGLTKRTAQTRRLASSIYRDLASEKLKLVSEVDRKLTVRAGRSPQSAAWLKGAGTALAQCDRLLAVNDERGAYVAARRAIDNASRVQRLRWQQAVGSWPEPVASPAAVHFATLPLHVEFAHALQSGTTIGNRLARGDLEDLPALLEAGWRHYQYPIDGVYTHVELSPTQPHRGRFSLRLSARPAGDEPPPRMLETAPVWVTSAPVAVERGQLLRIHGWVRVPRTITGSVDGLLVFDSLGGRALAQRIGRSHDWSEFTLFRAAPEAGQLTMTFALTGLGEAWLDDVTVEPLRFTGDLPIPQATRSQDPFLRR